MAVSDPGAGPHVAYRHVIPRGAVQAVPTVLLAVPSARTLLGAVPDRGRGETAGLRGHGRKRPERIFHGRREPAIQYVLEKLERCVSGPEERGRGQTPVHIFADKYGVYEAIISAMPLVSALFLVMNRFSL